MKEFVKLKPKHFVNSVIPAEVRDLVEPTISYSDIEDLIEINTPVYFPKIEYLAGDAGEIIS